MLEMGCKRLHASLEQIFLGLNRLDGEISRRQFVRVLNHLHQIVFLNAKRTKILNHHTMNGGFLVLFDVERGHALADLTDQPRPLALAL